VAAFRHACMGGAHWHQGRELRETRGGQENRYWWWLLIVGVHRYTGTTFYRPVTPSPRCSQAAPHRRYFARISNYLDWGPLAADPLRAKAIVRPREAQGVRERDLRRRPRSPDSTSASVNSLRAPVAIQAASPIGAHQAPPVFAGDLGVVVLQLRQPFHTHEAMWSHGSPSQTPAASHCTPSRRSCPMSTKVTTLDLRRFRSCGHRARQGGPVQRRFTGAALGGPPLPRMLCRNSQFGHGCLYDRNGQNFLARKGRQVGTAAPSC